MDDIHGVVHIQYLTGWIAKIILHEKYRPDENRSFMDGHYLARTARTSGT
jgi:hypothetical protein